MASQSTDDVTFSLLTKLKPRLNVTIRQMRDLLWRATGCKDKCEEWWTIYSFYVYRMQ